ncbi:tetratricopeptide repeat protein [Bombilactobacillus thymidiniphilus]|uniref:Tetratricopeptide repeat protein n=1 Tax=Bombilactobacillus thymidiniphilus TaxID=2923363 RepID=A0ABY4PDS1_9LACO|nr:tetratricopeptide repeat protein [Bombilactobacillus thymidiniphilus]UQS83715.1 tetratricopeptide repeat protein [Bombilactobacillus thymidiniphilus]
MSFIYQALAALDAGNIVQTQELVQQALTQDNDDDLFNGAQQLANKGISDQAAIIYQHLLQKYPDEDLLKVNLAEILISDDQIETATDLLDQVKPESEAYLSALMVAADMYQTLGFYEVSEQKLQTALKLAPEEPVIQFALAELFFNENKFMPAINFYERLLEQDISVFAGISLHQRLAAAYAGNGQYEQAVEQYQQTAMELMNTDNLYNYASLELELKHYDEAKKITQQLLELSPDYSPAYVLTAKLAWHNDDYQEVVQAAQSGLSYDQFNQLLYKLGAKAAGKLGDESTAIKLLTTGIATLDAPADLILLLSDLYLQQAKFTESLQLLEQYQVQLSDEPKTHWNTARSLVQLDQEQKALSEMLAVFQELKQNSRYLKDLINILQTNGRTDLLPMAIQQYLQLVPDDWQMQELLQEVAVDNDN